MPSLRWLGSHQMTGSSQRPALVQHTHRQCLPARRGSRKLLRTIHYLGAYV